MNEAENISPKPDFQSEHEVLLEWWEALKQKYRGDRAGLRRAASLQAVMFNPAFHRLWHRLHGTKWTHPDRVALIAALAARVKEHKAGKSFAFQLGSPPAGRDKAPLSGLRFRRLLQITEPEELLQACTRAVAMLDGKVNLTDLANDVYWWNDRVRKNWAFDYYEAAPEKTE